MPEKLWAILIDQGQVGCPDQLEYQMAAHPFHACKAGLQRYPQARCVLAVDAAELSGMQGMQMVDKADQQQACLWVSQNWVWHECRHEGWADEGIGDRIIKEGRHLPARLQRAA